LTNYAYRPGLWFLTDNAIFERPPDESTGLYFPVCLLRGACKRDRAAVILAAPDLLRACEALVAAANTPTPKPKLAAALSQARAAIQKAKTRITE